jgi:hypothetical protein
LTFRQLRNSTQLAKLNRRAVSMDGVVRQFHLTLVLFQLFHFSGNFRSIGLWPGIGALAARHIQERERMPSVFNDM